MTKRDLRAEILAQLKAQLPAEKQMLDKKLLARLCQTEIYQNSQTIATFLAMPHEFNTEWLIQQALSDGKRVVVPRTLPHRQMEFVEVGTGELVRSRFGVLEPIGGRMVPSSDIDLIQAPGLAWNAAGFRIGYGGGYYDRYLADFTGQTVSLIYPFQRVEFVPDSFDIAVKEVVCESI